MGDNLGPNGLSRGCKGLLLQVDETKIVAHEADDPNAFVDFFDSQVLAGKDGRDVDAFSMHADAAACGDQEVAVVQGVCELGQAHVAPGRRLVESSAGRFMSMASCGLSWLNSFTNSSKRACCCRLFMPGGRVASFLSVTCTRRDARFVGDFPA